MIQTAIVAHLAELHAFANACPAYTEVTEILAGLGFSLVFSMQAVPPPRKGTPHLPAQYHYKDGSGTEVIFLAGKDSGEEGRWITPHASRFWIYPGRSQYCYNLVMQELTKRWKLEWLEEH